jgi:hypothetical protein
MAILQSDGVNHTSDLILRRNGTEGLRLTSSTVQLSSINNGPLAGFRNAIINGNFDIWQRGTSFGNIGSGSYSADRWQAAWGGGSGSARTISRELFTLGQTDVPGEPSYFLRWNQTAGGTSNTFNALLHRIESVRTFAGQTITLSFYAKASNSLTLAHVRADQFYGSTGGSSTVVTTFAQNVSVGTSWQKYAFTVPLPAISGTIGSAGNDQVAIDFALPLNTTFTFDIAQVQVEAGPVATPFERRPIGAELALCKRYYQLGGKYQRLQPVSGFNAPAEVTVYFSPEMRATPSVSITPVFRTGFDAEFVNDVTTRHFGARASSNVSTSPNAEFNGIWTANAEF